MIRTCSFCLYFGEPWGFHGSDSCPRCGRQSLRDATEWEMFMGKRLTLNEELEVRERVADLLKRERHE